jgi:hypothetical protein
MPGNAETQPTVAHFATQLIMLASVGAALNCQEVQSRHDLHNSTFTVRSRSESGRYAHPCFNAPASGLLKQRNFLAANQ